MKQGRSQCEPGDQSWQVVKPGDCAIAFGIPVSIEDFQRTPMRGFVRQFFKANARIERFLADYALTSGVMKECRACVVTNLTLERFGDLFNRHQVVILFSHSENSTMEFHDGLFEIDKVVEQIPMSVDGIVDITMCFSRELFRALKRKRPRCFPFYATEESLDAQAWLFFYKALFMYLNSRELTYPQASKDLVSGFLKKVKLGSAEWTS